jgi:hypothetical protein
MTTAEGEKEMIDDGRERRKTEFLVHSQPKIIALEG